MTLTPVLGTLCTVGIGATGTDDITDWVSSIDLGDSYNANDVTTFGHDQVVESKGLRAFDISFSGFWDATIDATLSAEQGVEGHQLIVKPNGSSPTLTYTGWLGDFNISVGGPGDDATFDCTYHVASFSRT